MLEGEFPKLQCPVEFFTEVHKIALLKAHVSRYKAWKSWESTNLEESIPAQIQT